MILRLLGFVCAVAFATGAGAKASHSQYDFVVAKDGSGNFRSVQAAINACPAFPSRTITIFIKNGVYHEKVTVPSCNTHLTLIGESVEKTIITYNDYAGKMKRGRNSTFYTYTFLVQANDFRAEKITFRNSAGAVGQAVALHVEGDRAVFVNCRILGNQDTLYLTGEYSRDYFVKCYISGTTDFIFGSATALFDNCDIHSKANSYITAASTPKDKDFGFVFRYCKLTADKNVKKAYLGRPWRDFARVAFIHCIMGKHIVAAGWANWANTERYKTAFFAEYENVGAGATVQNRASWSRQLTDDEVESYSLETILAPVIFPDDDPPEWTGIDK